MCRGGCLWSEQTQEPRRVGLCPEQPSIKDQTWWCSSATRQDSWQGGSHSGHPRGLGTPHPALDSWPCPCRRTSWKRPARADGQNSAMETALDTAEGPCVFNQDTWGEMKERISPSSAERLSHVVAFGPPPLGCPSEAPSGNTPALGSVVELKLGGVRGAVWPAAPCPETAWWGRLSSPRRWGHRTLKCPWRSGEPMSLLAWQGGLPLGTAQWRS